MAVEPRPRTHDAPRPGGPGTVRGTLTVEQLEQEIDAGRIQGEFFLEDGRRAVCRGVQLPARARQRLLSHVVTDYERRRMFERG
jgi:hypothetical protein